MKTAPFLFYFSNATEMLSATNFFFFHLYLIHFLFLCYLSVFTLTAFTKVCRIGDKFGKHSLCSRFMRSYFGQNVRYRLNSNNLSLNSVLKLVSSVLIVQTNDIFSFKRLFSLQLLQFLL